MGMWNFASLAGGTFSAVSSFSSFWTTNTTTTNTTISPSSVTAWLLGGTGNDVLTGTSSNESISGGAGNDVLHGEGGNDTLNGDAGIDTLYGGAGDDVLHSQTMDLDVLMGGLGNDVYWATSASIIIENANEGIDTVNATTNYTLGENLENLVLQGSVLEGAGNALNNLITGNAAANTLAGLDGNDTIYGKDGNDLVWGGNGNDSLYGENGLDSLYGEAGDDTLSGGAGTNLMAGGTGNDTYLVDTTGNTIIEGVDEGHDRVTSSVNHTLAANVEDLTLVNVRTAVTGVGNALNNTLNGNGFNNTLNGLDGNDLIWAGSGDDVVNGGNGDDILYGELGNDKLNGGLGVNQLIGGSGNDTYTIESLTTSVVELAGQGLDAVHSRFSYTLGANVENLTLLSASTALTGTGNTAANVITGNTLNNVLNGLDGDDTLIGGAGNDTLNGGNGNDVLQADAGTDLLVGGTGNDTYRVGVGTTVRELLGEGTDLVIAGINYTLGANLEHLTLTETPTALAGAGNELDNQLLGNALGNTLEGLAGNDFLNGMAGDDLLVGGLGNDTLVGDLGNDLLLGGLGRNVLSGGLGYDAAQFDAQMDDFTITQVAGYTYRVQHKTNADWVDTVSDVEVLRFSDQSVTLGGSMVGGTTLSGPRISTALQNALSRVHDLVNLDLVRNDARFANIDGRGFTTVILDTGCDVDSISFGADADANGVADRIVHKYDFADGDTNVTETFVHGTGVASVAAATALGSNLIVLKVGNDGVRTLNTSAVEEALRWVRDNAQAYNIASVNMSFGFGNFNTEQTNYYWGDEIKALADMGVISVVATGNSYASFNSAPGVAAPANDPHTIAVGATWWEGSRANVQWGSGAIDYTTAADRVVSFSQRSASLVDVFAPGAMIPVANTSNGVVLQSGTSFAAPMVAGAVTMMQQLATERLGRRLSFEEVTDLLRTTGRVIGDGDDENDNVTNTGGTYRRLDIAQMAEKVLTLSPTPPAPTSTTPVSTSGTSSLLAAGTLEQVTQTMAAYAVNTQQVSVMVQDPVSMTTLPIVNA